MVGESPRAGWPAPVLLLSRDLVNTIPKSTLAQRICALSDAKLAEVSRAIRFALAI